jgi:hypothetical protein
MKTFTFESEPVLESLFELLQSTRISTSSLLLLEVSSFLLNFDLLLKLCTELCSKLIESRDGGAEGSSERLYP